MTIHVDTLHTAVETEPTHQGRAAETVASPGLDERARQLRALLAWVEHDRRRTAAEGYDD